MSGSQDLSFEKRPVVALFANSNPLSISVVEKLLASLCRITVVSKDKEGWKLSTKHLNKDKSLLFVQGLSAKHREIDYVIFVSTCFDKNPDTDKERKIVLNIAGLIGKDRAKSLFVFPFNKRLCSKETLLIAEEVFSRNKNRTGIVYTGELFGPRMFLDERDAITRALKDFILEKQIRLPERIVYFFPAFIPDVAKFLVKNLFSFGSIGEEVSIYSKKISSKEFFNLLNKIKPQMPSSQYKGGLTERPRVNRRINLQTNLRKTLTETLEWFARYKPKEPEKTKGVEKKKPEDKSNLSRKWIWTTLIVLVVLFISPFILLIVGVSSFYLGINLAKTGNLKMARKSMIISRDFSSMARKETRFFSQIPGGGLIFVPIDETASVLEVASKVGLRAFLVIDYAKEFADSIFQDKPSDPLVYSKKIALELDALYQESGFLQSEISEKKGFLARSIGKRYSDDKLDEFRDRILLAKQLSEEMPEVLGQSGKKTYLVLFQNNMELRPTGGFIGSFALLAFDKGRLVDTSVQDVYSADGQLKGHVEPPEPIKNYLGEANWFLRDSNWNPDFPVSATRAEWFLEKEINTTVDGVIAIDLELTKGILKEIGPIYLSDFDKLITYQNLYEVTQYEVEKDFFPGSYKKKDFLTALVRELLNQVIEVKGNKILVLARTFYEDFEERHIQIFLHDKKAQRAISNLGWDGAIYQPVCAANCFADWLGMVEANVGVNKANLFLERSANLVVSFEDGYIKKRLVVLLKNKANPALGLAGRYKTYLRILAPQMAQFQDIEVRNKGVRSTLVAEIKEISGRKEIGVLAEIAPGQTKSFTFTWEESANMNFNQSGEYRLLWRKQAGTNSDPIVVKFFFPNGLNIFSNPNFSLTQETAVGYNTTLARDFTSRIFW